MKRSPAASVARATGGGSAWLRHGPPATVTMDPARTRRPKETPLRAGTSRTRQLPVSAMKRSPPLSSAMPLGASSSARAAAPRSPLNPGRPVPATVVAPGAWATAVPAGEAAATGAVKAVEPAARMPAATRTAPARRWRSDDPIAGHCCARAARPPASPPTWTDTRWLNAPPPAR